jgi:hypothetical protein
MHPENRATDRRLSVDPKTVDPITDVWRSEPILAIPAIEIELPQRAAARMLILDPIAI